MKKNRSEKNKSNISIVKNSYCIVLESAGKRTQGSTGHGTEGSSVTKQFICE